MTSTVFPNTKSAEFSQKSQSPESDFSHAVIGAAVEVQRVLGTGLLESVYASALAMELDALGLAYAREVPISAQYKGQSMGLAFQADFVVENSLLLELKAQAMLTEAHRAQLLSYLRVSGLKLGLLINFHAFPVAKAIHRVVNKL